MPRYVVKISFGEQIIDADNEDEARIQAVEVSDFGWADIEVEEVEEKK